MFKFTNILFPVGNCENVAIRFCRLTGILITETTIREKLSAYPGYPGLDAVNELLRSHGVDNSKVLTSVTELNGHPLPLIARVRNKQKMSTLLALVIKTNPDQSIEWYNPVSLRKEIISGQSFSEIFTGEILVAENNELANELAEEPDYKQKSRKEKKETIMNLFIAAAFPLLVAAVSIVTFMRFGFRASLFPLIYLLLSLAGAITSATLQLFEIDRNNPFLKRVCHIGEKIDCAAILNSGASRIFGISWATIGFTYFTGVMLAIMVGGIVDALVLQTAALINILALPFVFYSLYYQFFIVRKVCPMCLLVQVVLLMQFVTSLAGGFLGETEIADRVQYSMPVFILFFVIIFFALQITIIAINKTKQARILGNNIQQLKHSKLVFRALLTDGKKMSNPSAGLGISMKKTEASIHLIFVSGLYCGVCSKTYFKIIQLIKDNPTIDLQLIFTSIADHNNPKNSPLKHLLAIAEEGEINNTENALSDWFLYGKKDYKEFATHYPVKENMGNRWEQIKAMREWCEREEITAVPEIFINGTRLPDIYNVDDLTRFLTGNVFPDESHATQIDN